MARFPYPEDHDYDVLATRYVSVFLLYVSSYTDAVDSLSRKDDRHATCTPMGAGFHPSRSGTMMLQPDGSVVEARDGSS